MLHVGVDVSRTRVDVHALDEAGTSMLVTRAAPDAGGLASLVDRLGELGQPVTAVIESMNGARFVHDQLELRGWTVEIADAVKAKGFAPASPVGGAVAVTAGQSPGSGSASGRTRHGPVFEGSKAVAAEP